MNQNSTVENDLQKAIDDITNNTNTDPVFSDPIAAPSSVPEGDDGILAEPVGPFPEPAPIMPVAPEPMPEPMADLASEPAFETLPEPTPEPELAPEPMPEPAPEPTFAEASATVVEAPAHGNLGMHQVKEAALRDLVPLMDKISLSPSQKFNLYRDIFENLRDYTVLEPAYHAAAEIPEERERAEALLYLIESIDKM